MSEASIYPIRQLYFQCTGCKTQWMLRADPPICNIEDLKAFTSDPNKMEPCPKNCGARTADMLFKVGTPGGGERPVVSEEIVDPFSVFDKERK